MESRLQEAQKSVPELELIVPISTDWTSLGTGGGIETFLKMFFERAATLGLRVVVPCSGPRESQHGSVRFIPLMRRAEGELEFTRELRRALTRGVVRISAGSVVLANEEHYAWAFRGTRAPVILMSHGVIPEMLGMRHSGLFAWAYRFFIERQAVSRAFRVVAVNAATRQYYRSRYPGQPPEKFLEVPVGLDLGELENRPRQGILERLPLPPHSEFVLFVGRLYPEKNVALFIQALDLVRQDGGVVEAVVVGDGIQAEEVRAAMKSRPWLHWVARMSHSDVLDLISLSRALVVCSRYEAGPLVLLEALGLGTPVVTTDVGRARELVSGTLGRIVPGNAAGLAAGLGAVLAREYRVSQEEREQIKTHLDFQTTMGSLVQLFPEAAKRGPVNRHSSESLRPSA